MTNEPITAPFGLLPSARSPDDSAANNGLTSSQGTDRLRIALGVNDIVIRHLFSIGISLHTTRAMVTNEAQIRIDATINELDAAIVELRTLIFNLETGSTA